MRGRLQRQDGSSGRQHDAVRNDAPLEVGRGHDDQRGACDRGRGGLERETEREHAAREQKRRRELDREVAWRDAHAAATAATAEERIGENRHVVVPADRRLAAHTRRAGLHDGAVQGHARGHHAEEAPECEPGDEHEWEDEVHHLVIDTRAAPLERAARLRLSCRT